MLFYRGKVMETGGDQDSVGGLLDEGVQSLIEDLELGEGKREALMDLLDEAFQLGGFVSWIKRNYGGGDDRLIEKAKEKMADIKTESQKKKALRQVDEILKNSPGSGQITIPDLADFFVFTGLLGVVVKMIVGKGTSAKEFREDLKEVRKMIEKKKVKKD